LSDVIRSGSATANGSTIITIDAGKTWRGSVTLSTSLSASIGLGSKQAIPTVTVEGTDADPVAGTVVAAVSVTTPGVSLLSFLGVTSNANINQSGVIVKAPAGNALTLKLNTTSDVQTVAVACGILSLT
jgi:hypothetical protein